MTKDLTGTSGHLTKATLEEELAKEFGDTASVVPDDEYWSITVNGTEFERIKSTEPLITIGSEYDKGTIKIGDEMTYKGTKDWIIFGKDESGNVLLASKAPVGSYSPTYDAHHWLTWEDDLDAECADYGTTLQGKTINARSIKIEDINRVVGFTEPAFTKYKFTNDEDADYENGKVNYYYPSLDVANSSNYPYMQKATVTTLIATGEDVPAKEFVSNGYRYYYDTSSARYKFSWYPNGTNKIDEIDLTKNLLKAGNIKYVVGDSGSYMRYYVASKSMQVQNNNASFNNAGVADGSILHYFVSIISSNSRGVGPAAGPSGWGLRPIVIIPPDIQVEEVSTGIFDIKN